MTNQERPLGEQEELQPQQASAEVAVAESHAVEQQDQLVQQDVAPGDAASAEADVQSVTATAQDRDVVAQAAHEPVASEEAPADAADAAEVTDQAVSMQADEPVMSESVERDVVAQAAPTPDAEEEAPAGAEDATEEAEQVEPAAAEEPETGSGDLEERTNPEPEAAVEETASMETASSISSAGIETAAPLSTPATMDNEGGAPVAAAEPMEPVASAETSTEAGAEEGSAEEASYTPVAEDTSGKPRRVKDLQSGMELEGKVTSIALYGIFVDIGVGRDGLVHISEMSDTRIDSPSDVVQIGDVVHVRVKNVEPDGRRISLTMRSAETQHRSRGRKKPDINRERLSELRVGDTVEGTVTGLAPFGVFVDIGVGKDGLVHISELSESRVEKAEDAVQIGQSYTFKLLEVDAEGTRISLSLRRAQRSQRLQQLEKGQIVEGTVSGLSPFGAFIDIGVGRDGLVHISELSEQRIAKVEDAVNVGDKVQVRILDADPQSKRISLSMRLEDKPREQPVREERPARERDERSERPPRRDRGPRRDEPRTSAPESYSTADDEETPTIDNATLEDLMSKYGNNNRRDNRRRRQDDTDEMSEDRMTRRQRDAIRRTIQHMGDDE